MLATEFFVILTFLTGNVVDSPLEIGHTCINIDDFYGNTTVEPEISQKDPIIERYLQEKRNREEQSKIDAENELQKKLKKESDKKEAEFFGMIQAKILAAIQQSGDFIVTDGTTTIRVNSHIRETTKRYDMR